jgi:hypothetical protein
MSPSPSNQLGEICTTPIMKDTKHKKLIAAKISIEERAIAVVLLS